MQVFESKEALRPERLEEVERDLGSPLPDDYRAFLNEYNGGYPEPDGFLFDRNGVPSKGMVDRFLSIYSGESSNLERYLKTYKGRMPANLVPIAKDPGGNLVVVSISGEDANTVYYWDHDEEAEDGEAPTYRNVYFIAPNFTVFLESLQNFD